MATPADQRTLDLLDKWISSLELHKRYATLDDEHYWRLQKWPKHQRPSPWLLDLALEKCRALRKECEKRLKQADSHFADSLEAMLFLANLLAAEHIERFIPAAMPPATGANSLDSNPTAEAAPTREMPQLPSSAPRPRAANPRVLRTGTKAHKERAAPAAAQRAQAQVVIDDAIRLLSWGRKWHEIAELIARLADRPPLGEVKRILADHKRAIDAKLGTS